MSKFENAIAEGAYVTANHGFTEEEYGDVSTTGYNALVSVSATTLLNLGENDLAEEFRKMVPGIAGALVWIRETNEGFVNVIEWGTDEGLTSGTDRVNQKWDEFVTEMDKAAEDEQSSDWIYGEPAFGAVNERETGWTGQ